MDKCTSHHQKIEPMKKNIFHNILTILSLIVALVALIVSFIALQVSRETHILSSLQYSPRITFNFEKFQDDEFEIVNQDYELFTIREIGIMAISTLGCNIISDSACFHVPFVRKSIAQEYYEDEFGANRSYIFEKGKQYNWAVVPPDDDRIFEMISSYVNEFGFWGDSIKPAMLNRNYHLINIEYTDKFHRPRKLYYKYSHSRVSSTWYYREIPETDWKNIVRSLGVRECRNQEEQLIYLLNEFKCDYELPREAYL